MANSKDFSDELAGRTADLLSLAYVKRWGVIALNREQSVAEHSFNVAVLVMELIARLHFPLVHHAQAVAWALIHDMPETLTGDIDGKFKRDFPDVRSAIQSAENVAFPWVKMAADVVPVYVRQVVKVADYIEAIAYIQRWGQGQRANSVYYELEAILFHEAVPALAASLENTDQPITYDELVAMVRQIVHHSVMETNCYQMRAK